MRNWLASLLAATALVATSGPGLALPPAHAAAAPAAGCHLALRAQADDDSFTAANRAAGAARTRLVQETGANFAAAASHLCASGVVRAPNLARYRQLLVRDAEGATEPNIYDDAEEHPGALIIEYVFDAHAPTQAEIETALRCWRDPHRAGCSAEDMGP
jgi:hypothetical protein